MVSGFFIEKSPLVKNFINQRGLFRLFFGKDKSGKKEFLRLPELLLPIRMELAKHFAAYDPVSGFLS